MDGNSSGFQMIIPNRAKPIYRFYLFFSVGLLFACASPTPVYTDTQLYEMATEKIEDEKYAHARKDIEELEKLYPGSPHIAPARLAYADAYYKEGEYIDAIVQYQRFLDFHPRNKLADKAQHNMAMSYHQQTSDYERDQTFTKKSREEFEYLVKKYPSSPLVPEAKEKIKDLNNQSARYLLNIAKFYHRTEAYNSAINRFRQVLLQYPQETAVGEEAMMFLAHSHLSRGSVEEAKVFYRLFLKKFPESTYTDAVESYLIP